MKCTLFETLFEIFAFSMPMSSAVESGVQFAGVTVNLGYRRYVTLPVLSAAS